MADLVRLLWELILDCMRSPEQLRAQNAVLRHQLNILRRKAPKKPKLSNSDRVLLVWLYRLFPGIADAITIVRPETLIRWHRAGFRAWWRWKSRNPGGRPKVDRELQDLIHRMCNENPLWGAPRIHGELLKLGLTVAQSTVSKYMLRGRRPPSQSWKTFLHNHADGIAAVDFLVVPTLTFERLFAFVVLGLGRRKISWVGVTTNPTAEWLARQITEAFPWDTAPEFLIRDNDGAYGEVFMRRLRSMAIRDRPITPRSPWQNGYVERVIGSIRRECLDHIIVCNVGHLQRVLNAYAHYYNATRTHLGLRKDAPDHRPAERYGRIIARNILGGLHHQYCRI
jgi:transposase InsO family protein